MDDFQRYNYYLMLSSEYESYKENCPPNLFQACICLAPQIQHDQDQNQWELPFAGSENQNPFRLFLSMIH
jgi:hypothetical protein